MRDFTDIDERVQAVIDADPLKRHVHAKWGQLYFDAVKEAIIETPEPPVFKPRMSGTMLDEIRYHRRRA